MGETKKGITKFQLTNRLLLIFIVVSSIFAIAFYLGIRPGDIYYSVMPATASITKPPEFLFAFYGEGDHKLQRPMDIVVSGKKIYISDADANKIFVFDEDGKYKFSFGKPGTGSGEFNFPYGLAIDDQNQIYVADMKNHRIQVFDEAGNFKKFFPAAGESRSLFGSPGGLAFDDGQIYVTDILLQKVLIYDINGKKKLEFGQPGSGKGQFKYPNGITTDSKGYIYVTDSGNSRVQVFDKFGDFFRNFNGGKNSEKGMFASPRGVKAFSDDILFVVNGLSNQVWACNPKGQLYYQFGQKGDENQSFNFPNGIDISRERLYITDSGNHGIKVYKF